MNNQKENKIGQRVEREKLAHTEDDVLIKSYKLKKTFPHVTSSPTMLRFEDDFVKCLQNVHGLRVLDIGCGYGEQSLRLLEGGAWVCGIDISQNYIDSLLNKVKEGGYDSDNYDFRVMDAHNLDIPDGSIDLVVGRGILHHLDLEVSLKEIQRVLKKGGRAVFQEPLAANPLLKLFRLLTPQARTTDEKPLSPDDLVMIENAWVSQSRYYGVISAPVAMITSILLRPFGNNFLLSFAEWAELKVNRLRWVHKYNQYVLLDLIRG